MLHLACDIKILQILPRLVESISCAVCLSLVVYLFFCFSSSTHSWKITDFRHLKISHYLWLEFFSSHSIMIYNIKYKKWCCRNQERNCGPDDKYFQSSVAAPGLHTHFLSSLTLPSYLNYCLLLLFHSFTVQRESMLPPFSWYTDMWWQRTGSLFLSRGLPSGGSLTHSICL